jgi:hypothetical protein
VDDDQQYHPGIHPPPELEEHQQQAALDERERERERDKHLLPSTKRSLRGAIGSLTLYPS